MSTAATPESIRRMLSAYRRWVIPISNGELLLELGELKDSLEDTRLACIDAGWLHWSKERAGQELTAAGEAVAWSDFLESIERRSGQKIVILWADGMPVARLGRVEAA